MGGVKNFSDQLVSIWQGSTPAARIGLILLALLCTGIVGGVGYWSMQPYYVTLASDLDPETMSSLVAELDRSNIAYEIRGAGSSLAVDKREWSRAQMLAKSRGVSTSSAGTPESLSPLDNPLNLQSVQRRNLENSLANSIRRYKFVEDAVVHLNQPERQAFVRNREQPSASVVLTLRRNERFSDVQAATIAALVAGSVQGLTPQRVTITDSNGNNYTVPDGHLAGLSHQEEYRYMREQELASRAHSMLAKYVGHENIVVQVTADFSFPDAETSIVTFDPKNKVVISEDIQSSTDTAADPYALGTPPANGASGGAGPAGMASNIGNQGLAAGSKTVTSKTENTNAVYENSKTTSVQRERTPRMNLMTVSVLGNTKVLEDASGTIPAATKTSIENVVKQAIGFVDDRDLITVEFFPFADLGGEEQTPTSAIPWEQITEILRNVSLAVGALVALVVAWLLLGRMKPAPLDNAAGSAAAGAVRLEQLGKLVDENPEVFSRIVAAWAISTADQSPDAESSFSSSRKEAA